MYHDLVCWGNSNPQWLLNGNWTPAQLQQILQDHITTVMQHSPLTKLILIISLSQNSKCYLIVDSFKYSVYCWDVVNEAVNDNQANGLYKHNVWYPAIPNYVDIAFETARKANPNTKLFYNDYNILMDSGKQKAKSDAVYNMTKTMLQNGIPLDGIGFQAHLSLAEYSQLNYTSIVTNFKRFAGLGLEIHITEMDVSCGSQYKNGSLVPCTNFTQQIETKQAEMYQTVLKACLQVDKCKNFESWGYTDRYTWKGTDEYPLPFDTNLNPKTAAYYIEDELL